MLQREKAACAGHIIGQGAGQGGLGLKEAWSSEPTVYFATVLVSSGELFWAGGKQGLSGGAYFSAW